MNEYIISKTFNCSLLEIIKFANDVYEFSMIFRGDTTYNNIQKNTQFAHTYLSIYFSRGRMKGIEISYRLTKKKLF